jgi:2-methylcitrate dehydratase PrpD
LEGKKVDAAYQFAKHFVNTKFEDLPAEVVEVTKKEILDLLGVMAGGFNERGVKELLEIITDWGGKEESTILGTDRKVPAPNAAHLNATMAHALDYDDVHEFAVMHPGITVIPTLMAMGERKGRLSGKELITGAALGVDLMCRLALATTPGSSPIKTGWHLTTLFGFLGAAISAGKILELDEETLVNAMGIAYHQCSGNGQCVKDGALTKRLGPGFAVRGGILSALMAEKGVTGAKNSLEGEIGLYRLYMGGHYDPRILTEDLGKSYEGINVAIKPYPCCRGIHPAIDAALAVTNENNLTPENIKKIKLFVSEEHYSLLCSPLDAKRKPRNTVDAQFSIPWGVATAIVKKQAFLEDFSEKAVNADMILDITARMDVEIDNTLKRSEKVDPTRVEITTKEEKVYSEKVEDPLGSLQRPMSFDDCGKKFRDCARLLNEDQINRAIDGIERLEKVKDISEIIGFMRIK